MVEIKGLMVDLDGVLWVGDRAIDGAAETLSSLRTSGMRVVFVTNTSRRPKRDVLEHAHRLGFEIGSDELITPIQIARSIVRRRPQSRALIIVDPSVAPDFDDLPSASPGDDSADFVILGDVIAGLTRRRLSGALPALLNGAELLALHKNRFWRTETGLEIDLGGFVAALEYAANVTARVLGKPSSNFFNAALELLDLPAESTAMIGDDIEGDVGGAQRAGIRGILVRTGKFDPQFTAQSGIEPDHILEDFKAISALLD